MKKILLILSVVMTVALIFSAMAVNTFAAEETTEPTDLVTEYGTIPAANLGDQYAIFGKRAQNAGESDEDYANVGYTFEKTLTPASKVWTSLFDDSLGTYLKQNSGKYKGGTVVVYCLKGLTQNSNTIQNMSQLDGTIVIDLGNNTLTTGSTPMLPVLPKANGTTQELLTNLSYTKVVVKNGNIKVNNKMPLVRVADPNTATSDFSDTKEYDFEFDGVTITRLNNDSNAISSPLVEIVSFDGNEERKLNLNVTFNRCTIDWLTNSPASALTLFDCDFSDYVTATIRVNGGTVMVPSLDKVALFSGSNSEDSYLFAKDETDNRPILKMNYTNNYPYNVTVMTDGGEMHLASVTDTVGNTVSYALSNDYVKDYGYRPISDANKNFSVFCNGYHLGSYGKLYDNSNGDGGALNRAKVVLAKGGKFNKGEVTILLNVAEAYECRDSYFGNFAQFDGTIVLDLNGKVFTQGTRSAFNAVAKVVDDGQYFPEGNIVVRNGDVVLNSPLVRVTGPSEGANFSYTGTKIYTLTCENVNFSGSSPVIKVESFDSNNGVKFLDFDATFNNCNFNVSNSTLLDYSLSDYVTADVTVNGGKIVTDDLDGVTILKKSEGSAQILKIGTTAPTLEITGEGKNAYVSNSLLNENGVEMVYVRNATGYTLSYKDLVTFVPKSSVTLWSDFKYNVYIPANNSLTAATVNGEDVDLTSTVTLDGKDYYKHTVALKVYESLENITLVANATVDGKNFKGNFVFSLVDYAIDLAKNEPELAKNMLSYARAAYAYFPNAPEAEEKLAEIDSILGENYDANNAPNLEGTTPKTPENTGFSGVTLHLGAAPSFRFTYTGTAPAYTFQIGGRDVEVVHNEEEKYFELKVYAYEMLCDVTFTNGESTFTYNVYSYYDWAVNNDKAAADIVARLIKYCESANAYRNSVIAEN